MSIYARSFCHWLSKLMGVRKKTPAQYNFGENESPTLLKGEVSQADKDSFCNNEYHEFLQLLQLIHTPNNIDHVANTKKLLLRQAALLCGSISENILHHPGERKDPRKLILIWDKGASYGLTPFRSNFIDDVKCDILVKGATKTNRVICIGTILHKFIN